MDDAAIGIVGVAVVGAQLALPLLLGVPVLLTSKSRGGLTSKARAASAAERTRQGAAGPAIAPLHCPRCQAPVPLESTSFACPFCRAPVQPPEDYVRTIALRRRTIDELARAERRWRFSRWTSSRPFTWTLRAAFVLWLVALLIGLALCAALDWPGLVLLLAAVLAIVQTLVGMAYASTLDDARRKLPSLPKSKFLRAPEAPGTCTRCGAPVRFGEDSFASVCGYCGGDNYRAALAEAARANAQVSEGSAATTLLEAVRALDERRSDLLSFVGFMAIAEMFYGVVFAIFAVADALGL